MADTYEKIFRQVAIRANLLNATDATTLETEYTDADIGATEMDDRASQFPKTSIDDAILNAGDDIVNIIGMDRMSPHRKFFHGVTNALTSGAQLPTLSSTGKEIQGVIGDVLSGTTKMEAVSYDEVINALEIPLKQQVYLYYTDNHRIWHTQTTVVCDVVQWDKADQRVLLTSSPNRGSCPFPQVLHGTLIFGALSYLFRGAFNVEQVRIWREYYNNALQILGSNIGRADVETRLIRDSE